MCVSIKILGIITQSVSWSIKHQTAIIVQAETALTVLVQGKVRGLTPRNEAGLHKHQSSQINISIKKHTTTRKVTIGLPRVCMY